MHSQQLHNSGPETPLRPRWPQRSGAARWLALPALLGLCTGSVVAQSIAYVPTHKSNSVSVINTATNTVIAVIPVGIQPLQAAISPDGAFAYITNSGWFYPNNDVSVISTATNTVVNTIAVQTYPIAVAITPDGASAYVVNNGQSSSSVSVINTAAGAVAANVSVGFDF